MKVRARLWLYGAVLPSVAMLLAVLVAGQLFRISLVRALDQVLRSQATVESVSLFDGPRGEPHLVLTEEQIERARAFTAAEAGVVSVYDGSGASVIRFPDGASAPERLVPGPPGAPATLATTVAPDGAPVRELRLTVAARDGRAYLLRLASPLGSQARTVRIFYQATLSACALMALLLFVIQGVQARRLSDRIRAMAGHLPHLREGSFGKRLPPDPTGDELSELRDALAEVSERLRSAREAQERLIANAAHELRTPLTVMRTGMDIALRRQRSPEELREALEAARHEVDRLALLASRLLDLASLGRATRDLAPGDLAALVRESAAAFAAEAETRDITIAVAAPDRADAWFEPVSLRQALDNYLSNALKFAPHASRVEVTLLAEGDRYTIEVADEGAGVPDADRERVFEPFYRAADARPPGGDPRAPGTGLGLAIVRDVARRHGGAAYLRAAGPHPRFVLELPAGDAAAA